MKWFLSPLMIAICFCAKAQDDSAGISIGIKDKSWLAGTLVDSTCNDSTLLPLSQFSIPTTQALKKYLDNMASDYHTKTYSDTHYVDRWAMSLWESDPKYSISPSFNITTNLINNWNTSYSWGNHVGLYVSLSGSYVNPAWISSFDYSKIINAPTIPSTLPPSGSASGSLTGNYPNPGIANNTISSSNIVDGTIVNADVSASAGIDYSKLSNTPYIPTNTNQLTNGAGFLTGITGSQVTTALGYTPYNGVTNPNGYITTSTVTLRNKSGLVSNSVILFADTFSVSSATPTIDLSTYMTAAGKSNCKVTSAVAFRSGATTSNSPNVTVTGISNTGAALIFNQTNTATVTILSINVLSGLPTILTPDPANVKVLLTAYFY